MGSWKLKSDYTIYIEANENENIKFLIIEKFSLPIEAAMPPLSKEVGSALSE